VPPGARRLWAALALSLVCLRPLPGVGAEAPAADYPGVLGPAPAPEARDPVAARTALAEGVTAYRARQPARALSAGLAAWRASGEPEALELAAVGALESGHVALAQWLYVLLADWADAAPGLRRRADRQRDALARQTGTIALPDLPADAEVVIDDHPLGRVPPQRPLTLMPGPHRVRITPPGEAPRTIEVRVVQGRHQDLDVVPGPLASAASVAPAFVLGPPPPLRGPSLPPLSRGLAAALRALVPDPPPRALVRDTHYWVCNEPRLELFEPHVRGLGRALVGVGTDQNYLLAGWARSELLVLMDFDAAVVDLHEIYGLVFEHAATPEAFVQLWSAEAQPALQALIESRNTDPERTRRLVFALGRGGQAVRRRLAWTVEHMRAAGVPTFLTDTSQYDHVRNLRLTGRVFAVRGDLTQPGTLRMIAAALHAGEVPVRIFYPSNAEQYFPHGRDYRLNVQALPADAESLVVRTLGSRADYGRADDTYHYNVQPLLNLQAWLRDGVEPDVAALLEHRAPTPVVGFSTFARLPTP
jgi:hypothetical protein